MFKTAATRIAHNSTIPSIGGNKDLRPLQDLITAEKSVLISLQRLSTDFAKASEALRGWGIGEGEDLGDTLSASTTILAHFSNSLAQYASHGQAIREHMKSIRTREEGLDELKRRRKAVAAKADSAEKKLNKMSPENKNLTMQTDILHRLKDEIRQLDSEIMTEEARLSDFKRSTTRTFMGLKFGGMLELSERGLIAGDFGKQAIAEIPEDVTQPGLPRSGYGGHGKTEWCVSEAQRLASEVIFSPLPGQADPSSRPPDDFAPQMPTGPRDPNASPSASNPWLPGPQSQSAVPVPGYVAQGPGYRDDEDMAPSIEVSQTIPYEPSQLSPAQAYAQNNNLNPSRSVDDFGVGASSGYPLTPRIGAGGGGGGRFATFPVKNRQSQVASRDADPPPPPPPPGPPSQTPPPSLGAPQHRQSLSFSTQISEALNSSPSMNGGFAAQQNRPLGTGGSEFSPHERTAYDDPAPGYDTPIYAPPPGPPPGAAPPAANPWTSRDGDGSAHQEAAPRTSGEDNDEARLAYADEPQEPRRSNDRKVRFGAVSDVEEEMEVRRKQSVDYPNEYEDPPATARPKVNTEEVRTPTGPESSTPSTPSDPQKTKRVPVPRISADVSDESSLNAAAAREVSREMDSLTFSPPTSATSDRSHSPLAPPNPMFAQNPARNTESTDSLPIPGSFSPKDPSSPRSPISGGLAQGPPMSNNFPPPPPPQINLPERTISSSNVSVAGGTPYRTPLESPTRTPSESPYRPPLSNVSTGPVPTNKSSSSLSSPGLAPGTRTISAAAFKRPSPRPSNEAGANGPADTTPLAFKKRTLPSSPYPPRLQASREPSGQSLRGPPVPSSPGGEHRRVPSSVPQNTFPDEDDQFDYITAYVNNMGSDAEDGGGHESPTNGPKQTSPGYSQGRFATNLEDGGLR